VIVLWALRTGIMIETKGFSIFRSPP